MITNASPWDNLKFDPDGVEEMRRKFFGTLYNTYSFFALYANVDGFTYSEPDVPMADRPEIDRWILSLLHSLVKDVDSYLNTYDPTRAGRAIADFINDHLSNWYVRLSRRRFWAGEMTTDKLSAYQTLYRCLVTVAKLMAPIAPFYADQLYRDLVSRGTNATEYSVHLADFPQADRSEINEPLERSMHLAQSICSMVLALRRKVNIKVRQPLQRLMIPVTSEEDHQAILPVVPLILSEVNLKELQFVTDGEGILVKRIKPDFKKLGPRYGKIMKSIAAVVAELSQEQIATIERTGQIDLTVEGSPVTILRDDVEIYSEDIPGWLVANEGTLTIALDITITDELRLEGMARELVNRIQNLRKQSGFEVSDKVRLTLPEDKELHRVLTVYGSYIAKEVQAVSIEEKSTFTPTLELDLDERLVPVYIEKAI